jgi:LPXTG-site transpeptidase (sortase) family protein
MQAEQRDATTNHTQDTTSSLALSPAPRRVSRRAFLGLALASLAAAACKKEEIVYVSAPTPVPTAAPPAPTVAPTAAPKPEAKPAAKPVTAAQRPIQMPVPVAAGPVGAMGQVIPPVQPRTRPYANRLQAPERLQIPSIDLDTKVVPVGTKADENGRIIWETAAFTVGHHKGTGLPGENGNVVLSGHISSPREGAVFNKLPKLKEGDGIIVATADRQYLYVVTETKTVTPDQVDVLDPTDESIVTMITCVPDGIYSHRLIVRAAAV